MRGVQVSRAWQLTCILTAGKLRVLPEFSSGNNREKHRAEVAELVDALASGASARKGVEVRVFSWAPKLLHRDAFAQELSKSFYKAKGIRAKYHSWIERDKNGPKLVFGREVAIQGLIVTFVTVFTLSLIHI